MSQQQPSDLSATEVHGNPCPDCERLRAALEIIAGRRQCLDNLMSHADIARAALNIHQRGDMKPRDDGTVIAVGGEPGASAGKSE